MESVEKRMKTIYSLVGHLETTRRPGLRGFGIRSSALSQVVTCATILVLPDYSGKSNGLPSPAIFMEQTEQLKVYRRLF